MSQSSSMRNANQLKRLPDREFFRSPTHFRNRKAAWRPGLMSVVVISAVNHFRSCKKNPKVDTKLASNLLTCSEQGRIGSRKEKRNGLIRLTQQSERFMANKTKQKHQRRARPDGENKKAIKICLLSARPSSFRVSPRPTSLRSQ